MLRECNLDEISDGKKYSINDMVKADCDDCKGCSACCHGMATTKHTLSANIVPNASIARLRSGSFSFPLSFSLLSSLLFDISLIQNVLFAYCLVRKKNNIMWVSINPRVIDTYIIFN